MMHTRQKPGALYVRRFRINPYGFSDLFPSTVTLMFDYLGVGNVFEPIS